MKILAIETSAPIGGVALWEGGTVLAERLFNEHMNHAQELFPAIEAMNHDAGWAPTTPDLIAVSMGPGSFTGLRVGIAAAKMLSYAIGADLIGVPTLDVLVRNVSASVGLAAPVIDAKRKAVYARSYERRGNAWEARTELTVQAPNDLAKMLPQGTTVFGSGAEQYADVFSSHGHIVVSDTAYTQARPCFVAELGAQLYLSGERTDREALIPIYLRRPEAEEKKGTAG